MTTAADSPLVHIRVHDIMHTGVLTTEPETPLRVVAALMAEQRVHAVAVSDPAHSRRPWGIVTALDVVRAVVEDGDYTAAQAALTDVVTITSSSSVLDAALEMAHHNLQHLLVVDAATGHPTGFVSALDVAAAYAA